MVAQGGLGRFFVELEGNDVIGLQVAGQAAGQHDGIAAERAGRRGGALVAHQLAAAALAGVNAHLHVVPRLLRRVPVHVVLGVLLQRVVIALERLHVEGRVAVRALHLLQAAVEFQAAAAAGAFVLDRFSHARFPPFRQT